MSNDDHAHVDELRYAIVLKPGTQIAVAAMREGQIGTFTFRLFEGTATFTPTAHYTDIEAARTVLDPLLRGWEFDIALAWGRDELTFRYLDSDITVEPTCEGIIHARITEHVAVSDSFSAVVTRGNYPHPPEAFAVDELVQTLGELYFLASGTPRIVLYIGYSMLTLIEQAYDGRREAADALGLSANLLEEIARITNTRGNGVEARKHVRGQQKDPLSPAERDWLMRVLQLIVRRAGAAAAGGPVGDTLTLANMPLPNR